MLRMKSERVGVTDWLFEVSFAVIQNNFLLVISGNDSVLVKMCSTPKPLSCSFPCSISSNPSPSYGLKEADIAGGKNPNQ